MQQQQTEQITIAHSAQATHTQTNTHMKNAVWWCDGISFLFSFRFIFTYWCCCCCCYCCWCCSPKCISQTWMAKRQITADKRRDITVKINNNNKNNKTQSVLLWAPIQYENLSCVFSPVFVSDRIGSKGTDMKTDIDECEERLLAFSSIKQMCYA